MKRWVWITASLAALFGLQGALCAVACPEGPSPEMARHQRAAAMPCHGAPAESTPAPAHPASDDPCGCEESVVALTAAGEMIPTHLAAGSLPPRVAPVVALCAVSTSLHSEAAERLPPQDILLLKSTLLV